MHISVTKHIRLRHLSIETKLKAIYHDNFKLTITEAKQEKRTLCKFFKYEKNPME